jgi:hypothetical protein
MAQLSWEQVDQIQAATGANTYYRAFEVDKGWVLYIHKFNQEPDGDPFVGYDGVPVGTTTLENAQAIAQAYEDSTADLMSARIAEAARVAFAKPQSVADRNTKGEEAQQ